MLSGCIPKDAIRAEVKSAIASPEFRASVNKAVAQQATQTGGLNIGNIVMHNGSIWILVLMVLVAALFWIRSRKATKTADVLIGQMEKHKLTKDQKLRIMKAATDSKINVFLKNRLKKVRRKMKKENNDG